MISSVRRIAQKAARTFSTEGVVPAPLTHFTELEIGIRDAARDFAQKVVLPQARAVDEAGHFPAALLDEVFAAGFMGIEIPEEYNGLGGNFMSSLLAVEEITRHGRLASLTTMIDIQNTIINTVIRKFGTEEQRKEILPNLATKSVASFCLSEADAGSDAFAMKTRAEKKSDHYVINGSKMWISNSKEAKYFIVFANLFPERGHKGITAFLVERGTPGFEIGKPEDKLSIRASSTCPLTFDDVKVPHSNLLGVEGEGYKICMEVLNDGRVGIAAQALGIAQAAMDIAMPYLFQRKQFGDFIGNRQGIQFEFANAACEIEAARLLTLQAARKREAGESIMMEASMAKMKAAQVAQKVASLGVEWLGGTGIVNASEIERLYRDSCIVNIYEGTRHMQLNTIAKCVKKQYVH